MFRPLFLARQRWATAGLLTATAILLAACQSHPESTRTGPSGSGAASTSSSQASSPRAYRQDAARHLYGQNAQRVYPGKLPPMLYAVGVLEVDIDRSGGVTRVHWMRAPRHAPEVMAEIEQLVRAAAPFPAPTRLGRVTYTDVWLWDRSGRFQLDTLTEGQN